MKLLSTFSLTCTPARWRKAAANDPHFQPSESEWRKAKRFLLIELHLVALIPLAAVIMARGIGYAG